jgi:sulfite reductase (ferredoxin)
MYTLPSNLSDDIKYLDSLIVDFLAGKVEPVKFKATRVPMGIYEQRKDGSFMVRIRCAGGYISPFQLKGVAEIAHRHNSDLLHLTTRQEIQIMNLKLNEVPQILQDLKEIGLSSKGGGGNTVRNIMVSVDSGIAIDEVFDVLPYAVNLTSKLIAEPDSFTLPRKFKITFSSSDKDTGFAAFNDLGFIAKIRDGKRGFQVFLGGGLASKPMVGFELFDFAPEEDLFYIADAAKKLFSRYGNRKNKHKARLRFVFYKLGKEKVLGHFFEIYNEIKVYPKLRYDHKELSFPGKTIDLKAEVVENKLFDTWKQRYANEQKQKGFYSILVPFENGNIGYEHLIKIGTFTSAFGDDVLRFSMRQNLHLRNIPEKYLGNVYNFLSGIEVDLQVPQLLNTLVSCTGADTCRLGICLSKGARKALRDRLGKSNLELDRLQGLRINISGCPNSCGQQIAADLGFFGKVGRNDRMFPAYHVVAGASVGKEPKLAGLLGEVSAHDLPDFTEDLFRLYLQEQDKYTSFSKYIESDGKNDIAGLLLKYSQIPTFAEDKNYYFDWGSDSVFSLASKGIGECSAGLFDMIDIDLATINDSKEQIINTSDKIKVNELLNTIVFASSRMLLITRGAEPRDQTEVFNAFITNFIDSKLISGAYLEIIEAARDIKGFDFSGKKETVFDLAQAVTDLYESMDDSLQFRVNEKGLPVKETQTQNPAVTRHKDFRNVACPMNFVKTKIELSTLNSGDILEILIDDGEPIENVPGSIINEGHKVLSQKQLEKHWSVTIQKA